MHELKIFERAEFGKVRVVMKDGEPWFVARDVAEALEYSKGSLETPGKLFQHIPQEWTDRKRITVRSENGVEQEREMLIISEQGLYFFLGRSDKPKALPFQKWLAGDVLPSIRRHGIYATDSVIDQILNNPEFGIRLLSTLKEEREKRIKAEHRIAILSHVNKTYTATEIAKELGFRSAIALNRELCERHIQFRQNGTFVLYAEYAGLGYEEIKQEVLDSGRIVYHRRWTQAGREWLAAMFAEQCAA